VQVADADRRQRSDANRLVRDYSDQPQVVADACTRLASLARTAPARDWPATTRRGCPRCASSAGVTPDTGQQFVTRHHLAGARGERQIRGAGDRRQRGREAVCVDAITSGAESS
jgi:hypothetical protein